MKTNGMDEMPPPVAELCAACVRFVTSKYKVQLDFAPDTLSLVDQYVKEARAEILVKPETLDLVQASVGAYLGEVIRRAHDGLWEAEGEPSGWRILMTTVYLSFNPLGMAREALTLEEQPGWNAHLAPDPADRFPDVAGFAAAIASALQPVDAAAPTTVVPVVSEAPAPAPPAAPAPVANERTNRNAIAAGALAVGIAAVVALAAMDRGTPTNAPVERPASSASVAPAPSSAPEATPAATAAPAGQGHDGGAAKGKGKDGGNGKDKGGGRGKD